MKLICMGTGKKRTLTRQISRIVMSLLLVGLIEALSAYTMMKWYHEQVAELEYTISDIYLSETDQNFNLINTSIRSMLYDGNEVRNVLESYWGMFNYTGETERLAYTLGKNHSVLQLKNTFAEMVVYYGSKYNFFFIDSQKQLQIEYGGGEYAKRIKFMEMLDEMLKEDRMQYTVNGKWFVLGDYICTIYRGPDGIGGAYMWAADFAANMLQLSPTECSSIYIYNNEDKNCLVYKKQENGSLLEAGQISNEVLSEDYYRLSHAGFACRFALDTSKYEKSVLLPVLFFALIGIYLMIAATVWLYTRRQVLGQVNAFYSNLMRYKNTERFDENMGVEEFAEAGKVLNQRSNEISRLKISVYEEQIGRQKVELDYAQLQIRPHFYINCLNIIHSMAQEKLTREIQEFVVYISNYFRYIFKKGMELVTVEKELEFTETYLKILECMNDRKYRYEVSCEEKLSGVLIPPLIIQTFAENVVKHNFEAGDDCMISVRVKRLKDAQQERVQISILDNGSGFDEAVLARFHAGDFGEEGTGYHIGIRNAVARMKMIYGSDASILFSNEAGLGGRVDILIPSGKWDLQ